MTKQAEEEALKTDTANAGPATNPPTPATSSAPSNGGVTVTASPVS